MRLNEMTVLVTGAASGIGYALAKEFLKDGATVVAVDRNMGGLAASFPWRRRSGTQFVSCEKR